MDEACHGERLWLKMRLMNDASLIDDKVNAVFQRLFDVSPPDLDDQDRRGELPRWDSLGHLELVAALEKEFAVKIPLEKAIMMETVGEVKRTMAELDSKTP